MRKFEIYSKRSILFWAILSGITLLCMWLTQRAVPIMMDDVWYSTVLGSEEALRSPGDIVRAQLWHYQNWGGRTVAHTILQFVLLYIKSPVADVLNTALIVLLAWMITCMAGERSLASLVLTVGMLHGLNANWKMSMYWQTGACNYLYTSIIVLGFLWLYLDRLDGKNTADFPGAFLLTAILGLLCGWTNENIGPTAWILSLAVIVLLLREKQKVALWMWTGNAGCLIGCALMILAPGNSVRSLEAASNEYGALWNAFLRMYGVCKGAWDFLFPAILVTAALVCVNVCILGGKLSRRDILLLIGALLSWGAMVLSPHYPDRAAFGTMCLLLCVALSQASAILKKKDDAVCAAGIAGIGVFIWLRGMYFLGEFLAISWGWIR